MSQDIPLFVLCSDDLILEDHLASLLCVRGDLKTLSLAEAQHPDSWLDLNPQLIFIDYIAEADEHAVFNQLAHIAKLAGDNHPTTPQVALGSTANEHSAEQARLHGINQFIDPDNDEMLSIAQSLIQRSPVPLSPQTNKAKHIVILGARPGVGASTFAAHLSSYVQDCLNLEEKNQHSALVDLSWPVADSLTYLNLPPQFHFGEAVQNLHRLDATLLRTALAHTKNGLHVLPLSEVESSIQILQQPSSVETVTHLSHFFGYMFVDLSTIDIEHIQPGFFNQADEIWLITNQSIASLVSLSKKIKILTRNQLIKKKLRLVLNQYNPKAGLSDKQIADQFDVEHIATLPTCSDELLITSSRGELLTEAHQNSPYMREVKRLTQRHLSLEEKKKNGSIWQRLRR